MRRRIELRATSGGAKAEAKRRRRRRQRNDQAHGGENFLTDATTTTTTKKKKRKSPTHTTIDNDGATPSADAEEVAPAAAPKRQRRLCALYREETCKSGKRCPHFELHCKPDTPNPDQVVDAGERIAVLDLEYSGSAINEIGAVVCGYDGENWFQVTSAELHVVTCNSVSAITSSICPGLAKDARASKISTQQALSSLVSFIQENNIKYIKAHNGITSDFTVLAKAAEAEGVDIFAALSDAGVLGLIDPGRIIPLYKLTELQHKKTNKEGAEGFTGFLGNEALFELATGTDMAAYTYNTKKLVPHRALDDAVAELIWLTRLPVLTDLMLYRTPQAPCSVSPLNFVRIARRTPGTALLSQVQRIGIHRNCAHARIQKLINAFYR